MKMKLLEAERSQETRNDQIVPHDPFRGLILNQVGAIISKAPSRETLHELLKVTTPNLRAGDIEDESRRNKLYKTLKLRVHPDKHPNNPVAKELFQNLEPFFSNCVALLPYDRRGNRDVPRKNNLLLNGSQHCRQLQVWKETSGSKCPLKFHVRDKWSFIDFEIPYSTPENCTEVDISLIVAYQCMNVRGTIAHGRKIRRHLNPKEVKAPYTDAKAVFQRYGGFKFLRSTSEIQNELMVGGPVVSTSFVASESFMNSNEFSTALVPPTAYRRRHPVLIVGWMHTNFGMVWLVQPFKRFENMSNPTMRIASGQYGIDNECIAPTNNFMNTPWEEGPYFDKDMSSHPDDWHKSLGMKFSITSAQLEELGKCFSDGIVAAAFKKTRFVLRDEKKKARSKSSFLKEVQWKNGMWRVSIRFISTNT